jgi:hypothetical protein
MTWKFYMPIWISSPAKVKKLGVIQKIITSIYKGSSLSDIQDDDLLMGTRQKITPYGYKLLLMGNSLQILPADESPYPPGSSVVLATPPNTDIYWESVLNVYGVVRPGVSMIAIENPYLATEIMGTINYNPNDARLLIYDIDPDTLPQNTLTPVDSIIDPDTKYPGEGLPPAALGQRYLIVAGIAWQVPYGSTPPDSPLTNAWPGLTEGANANDIIEFDGTNWFVAFAATVTAEQEFVTNLTSGVQYRYIDGGWIKSYEGFVDQGDWRIII